MEESPGLAKLKDVMKKNKNLRILLFKQKSDLEAQKMENLSLMKDLNNLEKKIEELEAGENIQEEQRKTLKFKQKYKNLERLFTKEKDEGLRLKRENQKILKILKKGTMVISEFGEFQSLEDIEYSKSTRKSDQINTLKTEIKSLREINYQLRRDHEFHYNQENINYSNKTDTLPQIKSINSYKR